MEKNWDFLRCWTEQIQTSLVVAHHKIYVLESRFCFQFLTSGSGAHFELQSLWVCIFPQASKNSLEFACGQS